MLRTKQQARRGSICAAFSKLLPVFIFIIPGMICFALATSGKNAALQQIIVDAQGKVIRDRGTGGVSLAGGPRAAGRRARHGRGRAAGGPDEFAGWRLQRLGDAVHDRLLLEDPQERVAASARLDRARGHSRHGADRLGCGFRSSKVAKGLYDYLQGVQAYLAPPIFVVFFLGVFWKRLNGAGCLAALIVGFLLGLFRLAVDTPVKLIDGFKYTEGSFLWIVNNTFFQYYSILILVVCAVTMIVVSYMTKEPDYESISGLTFGTVNARTAARDAQQLGHSPTCIASLAVLAAILAAYLYFTG